MRSSEFYTLQILIVPREEILQGRHLRRYLKAILSTNAKNFTNIEDFCVINSYLFKPLSTAHFPALADKTNLHLQYQNVSKVAEALSRLTVGEWDEVAVRQRINVAVLGEEAVAWLDSKTHAPSQSQKASLSEAQKQLRMALTGGQPGPSISNIIAILGKKACSKRLSEFEKVLNKATSP